MPRVLPPVPEAVLRRRIGDVGQIDATVSCPLGISSSHFALLACLRIRATGTGLAVDPGNLFRHLSPDVPESTIITDNPRASELTSAPWLHHKLPGNPRAVGGVRWRFRQTAMSTSPTNVAGWRRPAARGAQRKATRVRLFIRPEELKPRQTPAVEPILQ